MYTKFFLTIAAAGVGLVLFCANSSTAFAQQKKPPAKSGSTMGASGYDSQSKKIKVYKKETSVNFEDTAIDGSAKNPFLSMLGSRDPEFNKGFVKIRYNWHDQLIMSVSGLSQ